MSTTEVTVGRVGRAHGIRGEVAVEVRTDEPERRFAPGSIVVAPDHGPLTVHSSRWHQGRLLVRFAEVKDRSAAERLGGVELAVLVDAEERPDDPEEYYDRQLIGLRAETSDGTCIGEIESIVHGPQDLLVIRGGEGREILVPFVAELVPTIDVDGGRVEVVDLPGLLAPDEGG